MRRLAAISALCLVLAAGPLVATAAGATGGMVVDRIVARIEDGIITLSQMEELAAYQKLVDGRAKTNEELLNELIEQWTVNNEATAASFPQPVKSEVDREVKKIESRFTSPQAYARRLAELGLTEAIVRRIVTQQIYLEQYLDYKFRPAVQVEEKAIRDYYLQHLVPALKAKGEKIPPLDAVTDQIRELLIEKGINERAATWIQDSKSRLKIEIEPGANSLLSGKS